MTRLSYLVPLLLLCAWMPPKQESVNNRATYPAMQSQARDSTVAHLHTTWGLQKGGAVDTNTARIILDSPLVVSDDQGGVYTITRFRFNYRQKAQYKDDSTGKIMTDFRLFSREFYGTSFLDTLWRDNIRFELQSGESFIIDNIVVKDAKGRKALAPTLEFQIQ
jgi:hypothetical protein